MKQRTIFFDLGNVLIFFDHQKMWRQVAHHAGMHEDHVKEILQIHADAYERGSVDSKQIHEKLCQKAGQPLHYEGTMHALSDIFQPNEPVISIALSLKERGHRLFLLSNTCEAHFEFVRAHFPFIKHFDGFVLSYEVNARKPEKAIYENALRIAGCRKQECFYTDDVIDFIHAARSIDIDAEQYTTPEQLTQHLKERSLL